MQAIYTTAQLVDVLKGKPMSVIRVIKGNTVMKLASKLFVMCLQDQKLN